MAHGERLGRAGCREAGQLGAPSGDLPQHGVDERPRAPPVMLGLLDCVEHHGMGRHTIEVQELEGRQTQRFAHVWRQA